MSVRVVLFDLDDTLFAHREAVADGIRHQVDALGYAPDASDVCAWYELEERHYHSYLAGRLGFEEQRRARARDFAARHGVELDSDAAGAWFESYFVHYERAWRLHDDALPTLEALRDARPPIRLGLITNGEADFQRAKLDAVDLTRRLEHVVASGALGIAKPDPGIFEHAAALFGVAPEEAAYVGDRLGTDAIGAARAGLTGVWLNRTGVVPSPAEAADAEAAGISEISGLSALPAALGLQRT